jgi:hypothetical protein
MVIRVELQINSDRNIESIKADSESPVPEELHTSILNKVLRHLDNTQNGSVCKSSVIFYPSIYDKQYELHISYDQNLVNIVSDNTTEKFLERYAESEGGKLMDQIKKYKNNRKNYLNNYKNKYVIISTDGIYIVDEKISSYEKEEYV